MSHPAVLDDYLSDLLGDLPAAAASAERAGHAAPDAQPAGASPAEPETPPAPAAAPANTPKPASPALAVAPVRPGAENDLISDDEFEALLDQLHGDAAPTRRVEAAPAADAAPACPAPVPAPPLATAPVRPGSEGDLISDDEFEALLDQLHGGGAPTSRVADAPAAPVPAPAPVPAVAPAPVAASPVPTLRALPPLPSKPYLQAPIDTGERRRATERKTRWLRLRCDTQHYALELLKVQEVVLPATLLPLRGAAHHMLGVMNLRGQVVPVIDLGLYLGRKPVDTDDALARIVVLEENGEILGLRVSAVEDVANLTDQQIEPPENARVGRITNPLFRGIARLNERAVVLLDATQLLK